jgi:hypothetical protein
LAKSLAMFLYLLYVCIDNQRRLPQLSIIGVKTICFNTY